jgi:phosphoglycerate dehydrogenase-like enzyme
MWNIPRAHVERLMKEFPQHAFFHARDDREGRELIAEADLAFSAQIYQNQLARARRLRWIHSPAAGIGGMLFADMVASPIMLTNSRGLAAETIGEHTLAVTLAMFRRLHVAVQRQLERRWAQDEIGAGVPNRAISGAGVLVIGLGAIGSAIATKFASLGAVVTGIRRRPDRGGPSGIRVVGPNRLYDLLPLAEVIVIAAPDTAATRHIISARELAVMRTDALVVNVSRGKLVDERALTHALESSRLGGAALDVFEHEPLDPMSPLWALPNVLITPHTSGFRPDHWDAATTLFADNLRRFERGEPLLNIVDKEAGY